jgi:Uma2 family endonuclease
MVVALPPKLTVDEFFRLHGHESNVELVRGTVVRWPMPGAEHGAVASAADFELRGFARANKLGRVMSNDTLVRLGPDTTRGADVCFLSYAKLPADQKLPKGVLEAIPELVVEVKSPSDSWTDVLSKVEDYLGAGVEVVLVLDPATESASAYRTGANQLTFAKDGELTVPDVLPGFAVPVARFFEG